MKLLGRGKGGYSYLVAEGARRFVVKQIHHEPCDYYQFGDKLESELRNYERLMRIRMPMPALIDADRKSERILKEYVESETIFELVRADRMKPEYLDQMRAICAKLYAANTNIDYFPTNFVVRGGKLFYVDYECNDYTDEWNFENWGAKYWSRTPEFEAYERRRDE